MKPMKVNREKIRKHQQSGQLTKLKLLEEAKLEKDLFYQALAEQASESFIIHDFKGRIRDVNQFACKTLGYTRDEMLQMTIPDIEMDFDLESAQREWRKIKPNAQFTLNGHQRRKDGTVFPVEIRFGCVEWKGETLYLGLIRDITDWVKAEKDLKDKETFNRMVMDNLPIGIAVSSVSPEVQFIYMNDHYPEIYGTSRKVLEQNNNFWDVVYEDERFRKRIKTQVEEDIASGDQSRMQWHNIPIERKGHETKYITAYAKPIPGQDKVISTVVDVTDRVEVKNKLLKTQSFLNETQRLAQVGGWEYDVNTKQIRWTAEVYRIFGVPQSYDPDVNNIFNLYHPEDQPLIMKAFQRLLATGEPYDLDLRLVKKNGEEKWIKSIGQAEYLEGDVVRAHGYAMDISDQKLSEELLINEKEKAQEANRIKEQFLANMSHELRTPLNGLMGMTQLLKMTEITEEQEDYVDLSLQACTAMTDVVNEILNYTVLQKKQMKCIEAPFKMKELISEVTELHRITAIKKQFNIGFTILPQVPEIIIGDRYKLKQLLNNLVGNAVKFTESGSVQIHVNAEPSDQNDRVRLSFEVIDTGIGIQDQLIGHIFGRFNQVDGSHTREYGGLGLGLSIVNELSRVMGGEIKVSSVPGQGSNFCFACEMGIEMMEGKAVTVEKELLTTEDKSHHILVVDDDEASRKVTAIYLSKIGMIVDEANDGFEAIEKVKNRNYELILMDLQMPGMNGYDATKMIREIKATELKNVPILAMTALAMPSVQEKCMKVGMNDYLVKPLSLNHWKDKITYWIDHYQGNEGVIMNEAT